MLLCCCSLPSTTEASAPEAARGLPTHLLYTGVSAVPAPYQETGKEPASVYLQQGAAARQKALALWQPQLAHYPPPHSFWWQAYQAEDNRPGEERNTDKGAHARGGGSKAYTSCAFWHKSRTGHVQRQVYQWPGKEGLHPAATDIEVLTALVPGWIRACIYQWERGWVATWESRHGRKLSAAAEAEDQAEQRNFWAHFFYNPGQADYCADLRKRCNLAWRAWRQAWAQLPEEEKPAGSQAWAGSPFGELLPESKALFRARWARPSDTAGGRWWLPEEVIRCVAAYPACFYSFLLQAEQLCIEEEEAERPTPRWVSFQPHRLLRREYQGCTYRRRLYLHRCLAEGYLRRLLAEEGPSGGAGGLEEPGSFPSEMCGMVVQFLIDPFLPEQELLIPYVAEDSFTPWLASHRLDVLMGRCMKGLASRLEGDMVEAGDAYICSHCGPGPTAKELAIRLRQEPVRPLINLPWLGEALQMEGQAVYSCRYQAGVQGSNAGKLGCVLARYLWLSPGQRYAGALCLMALVTFDTWVALRLGPLYAVTAAPEGRGGSVFPRYMQTMVLQLLSTMGMLFLFLPDSK